MTSGRLAACHYHGARTNLHVLKIAAVQATIGRFDPGQVSCDRIDAGVTRDMNQFPRVLECLTKRGRGGVFQNLTAVKTRRDSFNLPDARRIRIPAEGYEKRSAVFGRRYRRA